MLLNTLLIQARQREPAEKWQHRLSAFDDVAEEIQRALERFAVIARPADAFAEVGLGRVTEAEVSEGADEGVSGAGRVHHALHLLAGHVHRVGGGRGRVDGALRSHGDDDAAAELQECAASLVYLQT